MNIFKKPLLFVASMLFVSQIAKSQEGLSIYSDYLMDNYYLLHPSMAGAGDCAQLRLSARQQWTDTPDSPALQTLNFNTRVGERSGVGAILYNDRNGYHNQMGAKLTYAHHINFSRTDYDLNQLSFGLSGGMMQTTLDQTRWIEGGQFDPNVIGGIEQKDITFNVDAGASYNYFNFYTHFTVKNLLSTKNDLYTDVESDNRRRYFLAAGYFFGNTIDNFGRSDGFSYEPSVLFQYTEETNEKMLDVNFKIHKQFDNGKLFVGLSYRTAFEGAEYMQNVSGDVDKMYYHSVSPLVGLKYNNLFVGYTYAHQFGQIRFANGGMHQLTLGYNFMCRNTGSGFNYPSVNY